MGPSIEFEGTPIDFIATATKFIGTPIEIEGPSIDFIATAIEIHASPIDLNGRRPSAPLADQLVRPSSGARAL
jgi:hypothetical protein